MFVFSVTHIPISSLACRRSRLDPRLLESVQKALQHGFVRTDKNFLGICRRKNIIAGSCVVSALLLGDRPANAHVVVANLGDSRAVLARGTTALRLSDDHKPNRPDEKKRIVKAGGKVLDVRLCICSCRAVPCHVVWLGLRL